MPITECPPVHPLAGTFIPRCPRCFKREAVEFRSVTQSDGVWECTSCSLVFQPGWAHEIEIELLRGAEPSLGELVRLTKLKGGEDASLEEFPKQHNMRRLAVSAFVQELSLWFQRYSRSRSFRTYLWLEDYIAIKATNDSSLDRADLCLIALWGDKYQRIARRFLLANSQADVQMATKEAIENIDDAGAAYDLVNHLDRWGRTYTTKTLRLLCPSKNAALDSILLDSGITANLIAPPHKRPKTFERDRYLQFLELCEGITQQTTDPGPRGGNWFIADAEMALFQFAWEGGQVV